MNIEDFNNLALIPKLLKKMEELEQRLAKFTEPIDTRAKVAEYLGLCKQSITNYIADGTFTEGKHYYRKNGKILVFMEDAIVGYKRNRNK